MAAMRAIVNTMSTKANPPNRTSRTPWPATPNKVEYWQPILAICIYTLYNQFLACGSKKLFS
jgi:hypothetical protein